ncbi:MAG: UvrD-helicase domain-containing protein [Bilophila sp.]
MNPFRVDLHVHSRFSRATSGKLNVRNLAAWSLVKGLSIMATGDFTHPAWRDELRRDLVLDETSGLYRVREEVDVAAELPGFTRPHEGREPLFLLQAEISSIYKKNGAVRKVHNLVFMPDMESADRLSARLGAVGNITSDGRPILGLDSERLLEMVLETSERGVLIPAHIWTPWFSLFGSKSGFDALEDCFGALSSHIFALETGLSSDPDMNRLWSKLDNYALVSNSDAHSGENLGREANLFTGTPTYDGLFDALRRAAHKLPERDDCQFKGTVEFFPEEGKYHLDGHRACNVVLEPEASQKLHNICPECGKPLTVGVLHRVKELADRTSPLMQGSAFVSLIPLPEMLGELLSVGAKSRKVQLRQAEVVRLFGSELDILHHVPEADLRQHWDALGEAVARMRRGEVIREGGYDGEYGVVRVFTPQERDELVTGRLHQSLLELPKKRKAKTVAPATPPVQTPPAASSVPVQKTPPPKTMSEPAPEPDPAHFPYSEAQQQALHAGSHPVLVLAGPGAGKTRTLVGRIERLVQEGVPVARILAVTFTRRAAAELHARLTRALGATALPRADTLHALALSQWSSSEDVPTVLSEEAARTVFATANAEPAREHSKADQKAHAARLRTAWDKLALHRERLTTPEPELLPWLEQYSAYKLARNMADYTDLLEHWLARLTADTSGARLWTEILVDEIQDFSPLQLALIRALLPDTSPAGQGFFGIGDPDQAIYGFRGAQPDIRGTLAAVWPELLTITLSASHRSTAGILISASQLLGAAAACGHLVPTRTGTASLHLFCAPDARHEAVWIAEQISLLLGGTSHTLEDARHTASPLPTPCSPGDIVVLVRLKALIPTLQAALTQRGIPCAVPQATPFWDDPVVTAVLEAARNCHGGKDTGESGEQGLPEAVWAKGPLAVLEALEHAGHAGQTDLFSSNPLFVKSAACAALVRAYKEQGSWEALLDWVLVRQDLDLVREHAEQVQIMTLHAAKGLEFRAVFVPALEEGLLPFAGATALLHSGSAEPAPAEAIAEERRLLYVGLTRAQDAVFLSHAEQRTLYGQTLCLPPSHFLDALPDLFTRSHLVRHTARTTKQFTLL